MILFYSGASSPLPESYLKDATVMFSYYVHVWQNDNKPVKRFKELLAYKKNKRKGKRNGNKRKP